MQTASQTTKAPSAEDREKVRAYWTSSGFELTRTEKAQKYSSRFEKKK
jgi:hypothetical protein